MSKSIWNLTSEATKYAQSRPSHPQAIALNAIGFLNEKYSGPVTQAVDVGCGTGRISYLPIISKLFQREEVGEYCS